jgi:hypothetical protein
MRFLGSLVISQLRSSLTVQLNHLGIPAGLVLAAGLLALITLRSRPVPAEIVNFPVIPSDRGSGQPQGPVRRK